MYTGPRYKIARRLGKEVFEKTQSQKYALRLARRTSMPNRPKTDYGIQMLEKQRTRVTYGISERQFKRYIARVIQKSGVRHELALFSVLEARLDNVVYRLKFAPTRQAARQLVSHGHITINGLRVNIPSYTVSEGDIISIRLGSRASILFTNLEERLKEATPPAWLSLDIKKVEGKVLRNPTLEEKGPFLDLTAVLEFYKR